MAALLGFIKNALVGTNQLFITFKQAQYWEGDVVEGQVTLISLEFPYQAQIEVTLKSTAQAFLRKDATEDTDIMSVKKNIIFSQTIKLFEGEITQREHSFSFQFVLPSECPGSFSYKHKERKDFAGVLYYVKANLQVPYRFDSKAKENFDVFEKQKKLATPQRAYTLTFNNKMEVWVDRSTYCPGDRIIARLKSSFSDSTIIHATIAQGIECQETKEVYYVTNHASQTIGATPEHYYGIMWIQIFVPTNLPPSTSLGAVRRLYFLSFSAGKKKKETYNITMPINILAQHPVNTLHPIASPTAPVPPPCLIRPKLEPHTLPNCSLCGTEFSFLKGRTNCMHCGKVFCKPCVNTKLAIPKLAYNEPEKVCRPCTRIVEETGGIKCQVPSKILTEWAKTKEPEWVPKSSKRDYAWTQIKVQKDEYICFAARDPAARYPEDVKPGEFALAGNKVLPNVKPRKNDVHIQNYIE